MKKVFLILLLFTAVTLTTYPVNEVKAREISVVNSYLGTIFDSGIQYDLYGTWPDITDVVPSSGTVTSFTGYMYIGGPHDPNPGFESVFIQINGSNPSVQYNGAVTIQ